MKLTNIISLIPIVISMTSAFTMIQKRKTTSMLVGEGPVTRIATERTSNLYESKMETFEKAVECAENFGYCDLEELEQLADELDSFNGNFFEHDANHPQLMKKEIEDRKDVAEILRLQEELRLRMDYLDKANLFAKDIHDEIEEEGEVIW